MPKKALATAVSSNEHPPSTPSGRTSVNGEVKKTKSEKSVPKPVPVKEEDRPPEHVKEVVKESDKDLSAVDQVDETGLPVNLLESSTGFLTKIQHASALLNALKSEYKALDKKWKKEIKTVQKASGKRKRKTGTRQPSGFTKPSKITNELAVFLGKEPESEMSRMDVTNEIQKYIKEHDLQFKENKRIIVPDAKLLKLLNLTSDVQLTYFNLQKYLSPLFVKKPVVAV